MASAEALYTPQVLQLATSLASYPLDPALEWQGSARSQLCGSSVQLALDCDSDSKVSAIGLKVHACAIGQAAAAIFAAAARGQTRSALALSLADLEAWLAGTGSLPAWPGLAAIEAARTFPARHGAILLAWRAALDALPS